MHEIVLNCMSGPIERRLAFKLSVVSIKQRHACSIRAVAREAGVHEKRVREWLSQEIELEEMMQKHARKDKMQLGP